MTAARRLTARAIGDVDEVDLMASMAARLTETCSSDAMIADAHELAAVLGWELVALLRDGRGAELGRLQALFGRRRDGR